MIPRLIEQSTKFIDRLYSNVEQCNKQEIFTRICQNNNVIYFIIHHVRIKRMDLLQKFYEESRHNVLFNRVKFFSDVLLLIRYGYNQEYCKRLLYNLINLEEDKSQLVNLMSQDLFKEIKRYNPTTYERRQKRVNEKMYEFQRMSYIQESSRGYAQIVLAISTYFQQGAIKRSHDQTWNRVIDIVGKYNLDFLKVSYMMLEKAIQYLSINNTEQVLAIVRHISFQNFIVLLSRQIYRGDEVTKPGLVNPGSMQIVCQQTSTLFQCGIYPYNPKYLELIRILIKRNIFSLNQFLAHFHYITADEVYQIEIKKYQKVVEVASCSFSHDLSDKHQESGNTLHTLMTGQAFFCFKFALMCELIRCNDFQGFKDLYSTIAGTGKMDIIIHTPLIRQMCLLIEWIIDRLYNSISCGKFFKRFYQRRQMHKEGGYFYQYTDLKQSLFVNLNEILSYLQINIGFHVKTLTKLCRLFKAILNRNFFKVEWNLLIHFKSIIKEIIKLYLFPAITIQQQNPSIAFEMNSLLTEYSQQERIEIYSYYYNQVMYIHPYLSYILDDTLKKQLKIFNNFNTKYQAVNKKGQKLAKLIHNQFLQCSIYLIQRALSKAYEEQSQVHAKIVSNSSPLAADGILFLTLNLFTTNKREIVQKSLEKYTQFIYYLFKCCKELDMSFFVKTVLKEMSQKRLSFEHLREFNCNVNIIKFILERIFPELMQFQTSKNRLQFLTFGYHLKLDILDQVAFFKQQGFIRQKLISILTSKLISSLDTQHCIIYFFVQILMENINFVYNSSIPLAQKGVLIDQCIELMNYLCGFFAYQMDRIREENTSRVIEFPCMLENDFIDLIRKEDCKIPIAYACQILRSLKKHDLYNAKAYHASPLKKLWQKIYKDYSFVQRLNIFQQLNPVKVNSFIHSDFYFYFWTTQLQNICDLQQKYREKVDQLRKIISKTDIFNANSQDLMKENKEKYIQAYRLIEKQMEERIYYYEKFNITVHVINNNKNTVEKISKFTIPVTFAVKEKDQAGFKEFVNLLFIHCLLPRMTANTSQAIFCSRLIYRIIKENKLPSNKSLTMIFTLIEAAISYVPYCTRREIACVSIFTTDFLRLFSDWEKMEVISAVLQTEIGMEKFNEKRYQKLKDFLKKFQEKIIGNLLLENAQIYTLNNSLKFFELNEHLPLSQNQLTNILQFFRKIQLTFSDNQMIIVAQRLIDKLQRRTNRLGKFCSFDYEKQLKKYQASTNPSVIYPHKQKARIYQKQQQKKAPRTNGAIFY